MNGGVNSRGADARRFAAIALCVALVVGACGGSPILANPPITFPSPAIASPNPTPAADPIPIELPRDDGPHHRLTEWWYYTGHLQTATGHRFGFEAVVFRAERGAVPVAWASHLALTDEGTTTLRDGPGQGGTSFHYAQRSEVGVQVDHSPRDPAGSPTGFDLQVGGLSPTLVAAGAPPTATPWRLAGSGGTDRIEAALTPEEATAAGMSFGLTLDLHATKLPALHDGDGFVDFGSAGSSYYYSRTRMDATGEVQLDGERLQVTGIAWFDHQWGDFVSVGGGGWDWFAINLDDGRDVTLSVVRDENANAVIQYGTLVGPTGEIVHLGQDGFGVTDGPDLWRSPLSGRTYPTTREIQLGEVLLRLRTTVAAQELDTRATTGVIYWEGSQTVEVFRIDQQTGDAIPTGGTGRAYVEVTRYDAPGP